MLVRYRRDLQSEDFPGRFGQRQAREPRAPHSRPCEPMTGHPKCRGQFSRCSSLNRMGRSQIADEVSGLLIRESTEQAFRHHRQWRFLA